MKKSRAKTTKNKELNIVEEVAKELFGLLGVKGSLDVAKRLDGFEINLSTDEGGIIIGYRGEVLEALQLMLSLAASKKIGVFTRIFLEVGDYKKNREIWLGELISRTKERVLETKEDIPLPNLKSWERRIVHLMLQDDKEVLSESVGEGRERTLVIKPR